MLEAYPYSGKWHHYLRPVIDWVLALVSVPFDGFKTRSYEFGTYCLVVFMHLLYVCLNMFNNISYVVEGD